MANSPGAQISNLQQSGKIPKKPSEPACSKAPAAPPWDPEAATAQPKAQAPQPSQKDNKATQNQYTPLTPNPTRITSTSSLV